MRIVCVLSAAALTACGSSNEGDSAAKGEESSRAGAAPWFEEVALERGLDFVQTPGDERRYWFPEIVGSGCALFDYDGDGDLDAYLVQSGDLSHAPEERPSNRLFENDGAGHFTDVTERAGVGDRGYGMGCAVGDCDQDGDLDLYVTNYGPNVLFRNDGDGTFTDVSQESGAADDRWGLSAAFMDFDGDGALDLFVTNYVIWTTERERECRSDYSERIYCGPVNYDAPARDTLLIGNGQGRFEDRSEAAGLGQAFGNGMGVACGDYDSDGRMDVYVTNDGMANQLWMNLGEGRFEDRALLAGCALNRNGRAEAGMGVAPVDIDDDGDLDLFMTHLRNETNTLYTNRNGVFSDRTAQSGMGMPSVEFTGFGLGFADFDLDGTLDLYIGNGRVERWRTSFSETDPYAEPDQVYRGLGGTRFDEVLPRGGTAELMYGNSRGAAFGDVDGDGDIDVLVNDNGGRARLLLNVAPRAGAWALLDIRDSHGSPAHGAHVAATIDGRTVHRRVDPAYSYCSSNDPRVHLGLGASDEIQAVVVTWPDGTQEAFGPLGADAVHSLGRGAGR